jgi:hypothetical protein
VIGVQTPANVSYLDPWSSKPGRQVEVLQNWLAHARSTGCSIDVAKTALAGRKIFVYAGNMGIAQGMGVILDLAERLRSRPDVGFLFVGRGTDAKRLRENAATRKLDNVAFFDEIDPSEIAGLYEQCHVGLVALDPRHRTHNIPGKFLSYMQSGLPVLANINAGNDLADMIEKEAVGQVCTDSSAETLEALCHILADQVESDELVSRRCIALAARLFAPQAAVNQIMSALAAHRERIAERSVEPIRKMGDQYADELDSSAAAAYVGNQQ